MSELNIKTAEHRKLVERMFSCLPHVRLISLLDRRIKDLRSKPKIIPKKRKIFKKERVWDLNNVFRCECDSVNWNIYEREIVCIHCGSRYQFMAPFSIGEFQERMGKKFLGRKGSIKRTKWLNKRRMT